LAKINMFAENVQDKFDVLKVIIDKKTDAATASV
jgi:hypothetical protein